MGIERCRSCEAPLHGRFCSRCGEKVLEADDLTVRGFLREIAGQVLHADGRLLRSYASLLRRPGELTLEWIEGRRKRWLRPIQLFLISNVVYFLCQPYTHLLAFNTSLNSHLHRQVYSPLLRKLIDLGAIRDVGPLEQRFDTFTDYAARSFIFLMIPLLAGMLLLLEFRRARGFLTHLVFATHLLAFHLLVGYSAIALGIRFVRPLVIGRPEFDLWFATEFGYSVFLGVPFVWYVVVAFRRVHGDSFPMAGLKSLLLFIAHSFLLFPAYRFLLFWLVYLRVR